MDGGELLADNDQVFAAVLQAAGNFVGEVLLRQRRADRLQVAPIGGPGERGDLRTGVVDVVFLGHRVAGFAQQVGERIADHGAAAMADMHRTGGIGRHVFHVDPCACPGEAVPIGLAGAQDAGHRADAARRSDDDRIAALEPRDGRRAADPHLTDHRLHDLRSDHRQDRIQHGSEDQIHGGAGEQHGDALPNGPACKRTRQFLGRNLSLSLIEQLHVAAQGNRSDAILGMVGVAADPLQQRLAETDAETQHLEAEALGNPVMTEFVDGDQYADGNQEGSDENQYLHINAPAPGSINATASRRAAASASSTSPRAFTGDDSRRCSTSSMTVAMPVKFKRRSRNA